jgi:chemotaxis protein CheX
MQSVQPENLSESVRKAAADVFSMMLGMEAKPLPYRVDAEPETAKGGILALIGFSGTWNGTSTVGCSPAMACRIADALFMTTHTSVEDEVLDAVAELTNMILGNVKTDLEDELGPMALSIPTVIYGKNFIKRSLTKHDWLIVPFESDGELIEVHLCVVPNRENDRARHGFQKTLHV